MTTTIDNAYNIVYYCKLIEYYGESNEGLFLVLNNLYTQRGREEGQHIKVGGQQLEQIIIVITISRLCSSIILQRLLRLYWVYTQARGGSPVGAN